MPHEVDIKLTCLAENLVTSQANGPFEWKQKKQKKKVCISKFFQRLFQFNETTKSSDYAIDCNAKLIVKKISNSYFVVFSVHSLFQHAISTIYTQKYQK